MQRSSLLALFAFLVLLLLAGCSTVDVALVVGDGGNTGPVTREPRTGGGPYLPPPGGGDQGDEDDDDDDDDDDNDDDDGDEEDDDDDAGHRRGDRHRRVFVVPMRKEVNLAQWTSGSIHRQAAGSVELRLRLTTTDEGVVVEVLTDEPQNVRPAPRIF